MKIHEILKYAINNNNWDILCETYKYLTGEEISPPEPENTIRIIDDDIPIVCEETHKNIERTQLSQNKKPKQKQNKLLKKKNQENKSKRAENQQLDSFKNKFEQFKMKPKKTTVAINEENRKSVNKFRESDIFNAFIEERIDINKDDPTLGVKTKKKRKRRPPPQKIDVVCSSCKNTFKEYAYLLEGRDIETWKCNSCCINMARSRK